MSAKHQADLESRKKKIIRQFKGERGCERCGEGDLAVLVLHHRDPTQKHPRLGNGRKQLCGLSYLDLHAELAKCEVLCANCHHREHFAHAA